MILFVTGFEIHGSFHLLGYEKADSVHLFVGWALVILTVFAVFWHMTTGAWRNYVPTSENLLKIADYYVRGIFAGEPHPHHKTPDAKLNPLQRLAYLWLNVMALPLIFASGKLYYYYNSWAMGIGKLSGFRGSVPHGGGLHAVGLRGCPYLSDFHRWDHLDIHQRDDPRI